MKGHIGTLKGSKYNFYMNRECKHTIWVTLVESNKKFEKWKKEQVKKLPLMVNFHKIVGKLYLER